MHRVSQTLGREGEPQVPLETVDAGSGPLLGESHSGEAKRGGVHECGDGRRGARRGRGTTAACLGERLPLVLKPFSAPC